MEQNKVRTYILYAIGEILLVVIGILIALQVNNWNEDRKDARLEQTYYSNLIRDLNNQLIEIDTQYQGERFVKESLSRIRQTVDDRFSDADLTSFSGDLTRTTINRTLNLFDATFQDLKSTGNLNLISDDELKTSLLDFYQLADRVTHVLNKNNEGFHHRNLAPLLDNRLINVELSGMNQTLAYGGLPELDQQAFFDDDLERELNSALVKRILSADHTQHFKNFISYRKMTNEVSMIFLIRMKEDAERLVDDVKSATQAD